MNDFFLKGFKLMRRYYINLASFLFDENENESEFLLKNRQNLKQYIHSPIKFTFVIIGIALGFFVIWGSLAPLDSAAIAPGFITLSGNHKTIQHLEGGVIDKILVKEGEFVEEDQPLIILNETASKARLQMILSQLRTAKATENRLLAEQYDESVVDYSDEIFDSTIPEVQKIIKTQNELFKTRLKSVKSKLDILSQKIVQHKEQIKGLEVMSGALESQGLVMKDQIGSLQNLVAQGGIPKNDLLELKKRYFEVEGRLGEIKGNIAGVNEAIAETQLQALDFENDYKNEINDQLGKAQSQILDLQEQYRAAQDILTRTVIKAPKAGIITNLQYHTISGVIAPGAKIMDIVPQNDELIVEARVMSKDIENIKLGLLTKVQLSAYKSRLVPRVDGEVIYFSADKINDERTGYAYYITRIKIKQEALDKINYDIKLHPGMPADVFIVKGERTFLGYLISPITDSFHRAFKES